MSLQAPRGLGLIGAVLVFWIPACSCSDDEKKPAADEPDAGAETVGVTVTNPDARACDVLLEELGDVRVSDAEFADLVRGSLQTRSPLVAVSFFSRADQGFDGNVVSLVATGATDDEPLVVREATCYDRRGQPLEEADLELTLTAEE